MNTSENERIDALMSHTLNEEIPADVEQRLRGQLHEFRDRLAQSNRVEAKPAKISRRFTLASLATLAASIVAAIIWLGGSDKQAWAEVIRAVESMSWIQFTSTAANGKEVELWVSAKNGMAVWQLNGFVRFVDQRQGVTLTYDPDSETILRLPYDEFLDSSAASFAAIVQSLTSAPETVAFTDNPAIKLVGQKRSEVAAAENSYWRYEFEFLAFAKLPISTVYDVDAATKLPVSCDVTANGSTERFEITFPDHGPSSIYEVGVPVAAKVIDRVPTDDVASVLKAIRTGRNRTEPYEGLLIRHASALPWYSPNLIQRFWREEGKWRIEQVYHTDLDLLRMDIEGGRIKEPEDDVDRQLWWNEQLRKVRWQPLLVSDGKREYRFKIKHSHEEIDSLEDLRSASFTVEGVEPESGNYVRNPEDHFPSIIVLPEQLGFPLMGQPNSHAFTLEKETNVGHSGTMLLTSIPNHGDTISRVWVDPTRQFLMKRFEFGGWAYEIVETGQAPSGYIYPRQVRSTPLGESGGKRQGGAIDNYYLTFDPEFPRNVFTTDAEVK